MSAAIIRPLAVSLPRLVQQLVGKEGGALRVENPEKYNFDPDKLLSLLIRTVLVFAENEQFILRMNEEGMLDLNMFQRAQSICRSRGLLETVGLDGLVDRSPISSEWTPS